MTDDLAKQVLRIFEDSGMRVELGALYSVKGQIAQLLNGVERLLSASERLCNVYFDIALEFTDETDIRKRRDKAISHTHNIFTGYERLTDEPDWR